MFPPEPSSASTNSTPSGAASTLLRHFPAEVREAYLRFKTARSESDADLIVLAVVRDHLPNKALKAETSFGDELQLIADLGFDSVAITEMVFFLEDLFQVQIGNEEIMRVRTIGDLRNFVRKKTSAKPLTSST
jgi:acyl carrier protein